ncbi:MAG TPA: hypothetical protein VMR52_06855 [Dehalococcoidia bacterium]|nr:hypothetical protein [Dehalococcoidia bacterium]
MKPATERPGTRARGDATGHSPPLVRDLGTIARLYGEVFWMIGQRIQHGRDWEDKLAHRALMLEKDAARGGEGTLHRHN